MDQLEHPLPATARRVELMNAPCLDGVVYQATVKSRGGEETYIGLAKNFKKRFWGHKRTLQTKREEGKTTLSTHFWKEIEAGGTPTIQWRVVESNIPLFNPVTKTCRLCIREKFNIVLNPHLASLNSR